MAKTKYPEIPPELVEANREIKKLYRLGLTPEELREKFNKYQSKVRELQKNHTEEELMEEIEKRLEKVESSINIISLYKDK